jgi:hypothetical protein
VLSGLTVVAQHEPVAPPLPPPPPPPSEEEKTAEDEEEEEPEKPFIPESEEPWGLTEEFLDELAARARAYREYALSFSCTENVRSADYNAYGEADKEQIRNYAYLLERDETAENLREFRQRIKDSGKIAKNPTEDQEPFPPAYGWVFLFSKFNQPYFDYRDLGNRFDGFDWVKEIQFRGQVPWSDGKDIRQWEGVAVVDAVTYTPLEIRAEPSNQTERIQEMYRQWAKAFNLIGVKLAPRPFGYRGRIKFRERRSELSFPTELRYDTFRAVSAKQIVLVEASIRQYENYRFYRTFTSETQGAKRGK